MKKKYVVFDLDETLGNFLQLSIFCDSFERITKSKLNQHQFNELCFTFVQFFRPNIIQVLKLLKSYKQRDNTIKVVIYTNNNGEKAWTIKIKKFLETVLNYPLFDQVIGCYKNSKGLVEPCRTTFEKTPEDFMKCTNCFSEVDIIFFDDQHHAKMIDDRINYIRIKPYEFIYDYNDMLNLFTTTTISKYINNKSLFRTVMLIEMKKYNYNKKIIPKEVIDIDIIVTKQMYNYLLDFLK